MSESLPERPDMRQLRTQSKELLTALLAGQAEALDLANLYSPNLDPAQAKLSDAHRIIARKFGFKTWPKLVETLETPRLIESFKKAIYSGDSEKLERLLNRRPALRSKINEPFFSFDSPAIVFVSGKWQADRILPILVRYGANPNERSKWWAGGFSALDQASGENVNTLLELGAKFDVWSAAAHGRIEVLRSLLDFEPGLANAQGGDGKRPLHFASSAEIVDLLMEKGADLEARDIDHESTPLQYQINNTEVARALIRHGARPDIFTAIGLNDLDMLRNLLGEDRNAEMARIGQEPFRCQHSNGGHIYSYLLSPAQTPQLFAARRGFAGLLDELVPVSSPARILVAAAWLNDKSLFYKLLKKQPEFFKTSDPAEAGALAEAAQSGRTDVVQLLLEAGFDPLVTGMDSGSSLHIACWFGQLAAVNLLIDRVPLDLVDANHGSPPLGWALHGAQWCRNPEGDYVAVVQSLIQAGADVTAFAHRDGGSMLDQAGDREDVKEVLREAGAQ
jgi:ankyrin repeat protein